MLITSTRETDGTWIVSIRNENTGIVSNKAGTANEVVNWLLNKAAADPEIDDALEKTIETWRGNGKELFDAYVSATI